MPFSFIGKYAQNMSLKLHILFHCLSHPTTSNINIERQTYTYTYTNDGSPKKEQNSSINRIEISPKQKKNEIHTEKKQECAGRNEKKQKRTQASFCLLFSMISVIISFDIDLQYTYIYFPFLHSYQRSLLSLFMTFIIFHNSLLLCVFITFHFLLEWRVLPFHWFAFFVFRTFLFNGFCCYC